MISRRTSFDSFLVENKGVPRKFGTVRLELKKLHLFFQSVQTFKMKKKMNV